VGGGGGRGRKKKGRGGLLDTKKLPLGIRENIAKSGVRFCRDFNGAAKKRIKGKGNGATGPPDTAEVEEKIDTEKMKNSTKSSLPQRKK